MFHAELLKSFVGLKAVKLFYRTTASLFNTMCILHKHLQNSFFSINFVEDKGLTHISQVVGHLPRGTKHLNLAHCGLSGKGVNPMATALVTNKLSLNSLTYLNLAGNVIKVG